MTKKPKMPSLIASNKKARHEYFIEESFEAGLELLGWEVKSIRAGKMRITESYVIFKDGEAFLFGAHIQPLLSASTHIVADPLRTRKLLLHRREIDKLFGMVNQKVIPVWRLKCTGVMAASNAKLPLLRVKNYTINAPP